MTTDSMLWSENPRWIFSRINWDWQIARISKHLPHDSSFRDFNILLIAIYYEMKKRTYAS
jgi:hypothetical protein